MRERCLWEREGNDSMGLRGDVGEWLSGTIVCMGDGGGRRYCDMGHSEGSVGENAEETEEMAGAIEEVSVREH